MLGGARHKAEVTQKDLAEAFGISQHHISEMENGKRPIGKEMAKRFAGFFKTDYEYLTEVGESFMYAGMARLLLKRIIKI